MAKSDYKTFGTFLDRIFLLELDLGLVRICELSECYTVGMYGAGGSGLDSERRVGLIGAGLSCRECTSKTPFGR